MDWSNYECEGQLSFADQITPKPAPVERKKIPERYCELAEHICDKKERWKKADDFCPKVCCRKCSGILCQERCTPPNEFHVKDLTLKRSDGWNKLPEEQPTFLLWKDVEVVVEYNDGRVEIIVDGFQADTWRFRRKDEDGDAVKLLAWRKGKEHE